MNVLSRTINMLVKPKQEWQVIAEEQPDKMQILSTYFIPWTVVVAILDIGGMWMRDDPYITGIVSALIGVALYILLMIVTVYVGSFILNTLASRFESKADSGRAFQLMVYTSAISFIASIISFVLEVIGGSNGIIVMTLSAIISIASFAYLIYVFYLGLPVLMQTPSKKQITYLLAFFGVLLGIGFIAFLAVVIVAGTVFGLLSVAPSQP